jgi:hypothetical protein
LVSISVHGKIVQFFKNSLNDQIEASVYYSLHQLNIKSLVKRISTAESGATLFKNRTDEPFCQKRERILKKQHLVMV